MNSCTQVCICQTKQPSTSRLLKCPLISSGTDHPHQVGRCNSAGRRDTRRKPCRREARQEAALCACGLGRPAVHVAHHLRCKLAASERPSSSCRRWYSYRHLTAKRLHAGKNRRIPFHAGGYEDLDSRGGVPRVDGHHVEQEAMPDINDSFSGIRTVLTNRRSAATRTGSW